MKKLENYEQILNKIKEEKYFLLYVSLNNCSVCQVDMPKVEKQAKIIDFDELNYRIEQII